MKIDALLQLAGFVSSSTKDPVEIKEKYRETKEKKEFIFGKRVAKSKPKQSEAVPNFNVSVPAIVHGYTLGVAMAKTTLPLEFDSAPAFLSALNKCVSSADTVQVLRRAEKLLKLMFLPTNTLGGETDRFRFAARSVMKPEIASEYKRSVRVNGFVPGAANPTEKLKQDLNSRVRVAEQLLTDIRTGKEFGDAAKLEKVLKQARKELEVL